MFIMKTELLVSLLCISLCVAAAAVVPVEDAVPGGAAGPVPEEAAAGATEEAAELSNPGDAQENPENDRSPERHASNCPEGWRSFQDHCYLMVNLTYTRINAEFLCENLGSSLASAHNLWEYTFLQQLARDARHSVAWIGGYRFQGYWRWDDGTPFDYNNWFSHDSSSYDECIYLNTEGSRGWSNDQCTYEHPFICSTRPAC